MKKNINAAVLEKFNRPLKIIKNIKIPNLKKDQILIKMNFTAICGSQIFEIMGKRGKDKFLPHMLGHEGTGKVIAVGNRKSNFKKNDKVFLSWIKNNNKKNNKIIFDSSNGKKRINAGPITTFSNYTLVAENRVYKLPKNISLKQGVLLGCALPTGAGMVFNQSNNIKTKSVLVIGSGGIGIAVILALISKGVKKIFVYEKNKNKIKVLKKYFPYLICYYKFEKIKNKNFFFDYVYECSGNAKNIKLGFNLIKNDGKCIFASHPEHNKKIILNPHDLIKGKKIEGSWGGKINFNKHLKLLLNLIKKFKFIEKLYFNKVYSLPSINKAINDFKKGKNIRALIKFSNE